MKYIKLLLQVAFFIGFAQVCRWLVAYFQLPIPGAVLGIIILFTLLKLKVININWIELGSKLLIAEMMLFFVPSVVNILNYQELIKDQGFIILFIIIVSTFTVMVTSGLTSQWLSSRKEEKA